MKNVVIMIVAVLVAVLATSCIPEASQEEKEAMCENLVKLRSGGEPATEEDLIKKVKEDFVKRTKHLEDWKARDLKGWDDELASKLAATEDEEEKKVLEADYAKKKEITASKFDPDIANLKPEEAAAIVEAKKKAAEIKEKRDAKVKECVDEATNDGVNQKTATCRAKAESTDKYWNACK